MCAVSLERYSDDCRGCRPAMLDVKTGRALPDTDPILQAILGVWDASSRKTREAYHRVCCQNSRAPEDLARVAPLIAAFKKAGEKALKERT